MKTETYNGWTNYETWNVKLWMDNEEGSYNYYQGLAEEVYERAEEETNFTKKENAAIELSKLLKDEFEEGMPEIKGCYADLLSAALSVVNWYEIAENMIDELEN